MACWDRSGENEALGIRSRDATANSLNADSVGLGIRQQYHYYRTDTENACGDDTDALRSAWSAGIACGDEERSRQVGAVQIHAFSDDR